MTSEPFDGHLTYTLLRLKVLNLVDEAVYVRLLKCLQCKCLTVAVDGTCYNVQCMLVQ